MKPVVTGIAAHHYQTVNHFEDVVGMGIDCASYRARLNASFSRGPHMLLAS